MAKRLKIIRGDSFFADIQLSSLALFDDTWSGKWAFVAELGDTPAVEGTLTAVPGMSKMPVRIPPESTELLVAGDYWLVLEVTRDLSPAASFRREVQQRVTVQEQGVPSNVA